jgi:hypothetical protein
MSNTTTVPHLVLERFPHIAREINIPDQVKEDLKVGHDYLFPILMREYKKEWEIICKEVDEGVAAGTMIFNGEDGTITLAGI